MTDKKKHGLSCPVILCLTHLFILLLFLLSYAFPPIFLYLLIWHLFLVSPLHLRNSALLCITSFLVSARGRALKWDLYPTAPFYTTTSINFLSSNIKILKKKIQKKLQKIKNHYWARNSFKRWNRNFEKTRWGFFTQKWIRVFKRKDKRRRWRSYNYSLGLVFFSWRHNTFYNNKRKLNYYVCYY